MQGGVIRRGVHVRGGVHRFKVEFVPAGTGFFLLCDRVPLFSQLLRRKVLVQGYRGCEKLGGN